MSYLSTIRPGLLVSVKTSIVGGIAYAKTTIEADHTIETGERRARWETERTITDPVEHEAATKARGRARTIIASICSQSAFGFLCPIDRAADLEAAIAEARAMLETFNSTAKLSRVHLYVIAGRIADDDAEAVRAISSEVAGLISTMEAGLQNLDVKAVRDAAAKARSLGQMLEPAARERVQMAIEAARAAARKIVQTGETLSLEIDKSTIDTLATSRLAFLDIDTDASAIELPQTESRAIDIETENNPVPIPAQAGQCSLDI